MKAVKVISIFLITIFVLSTTNYLTAQQKEGDFQKKDLKKEKGFEKGMPKHEPMEMIPNLTDEQKEQMKTLKLDLIKSNKSLKNEMKEKEARLHTLSTADEVDLDAIYKVVEEIGALQISIAKNMATHRQEVRKILTEEQKIFFDERPPRPHGPKNHPPQPPKDKKF
jgi:Spy/CpxP family protein refolding chaperone